MCTNMHMLKSLGIHTVLSYRVIYWVPNMLKYSSYDISYIKLYQNHFKGWNRLFGVPSLSYPCKNRTCYILGGFTSSQIKLSHSMVGPCSESTNRVRLCVYILAAHTLSESIDSVYLMVCLLTWRCRPYHHHCLVAAVYIHPEATR